MNLEILGAARTLLEGVTPLNADCGALCAAACCAPDEDGQGGVYLFPGEASLYANVDWARVERDGFGEMLVCEGRCERDRRPLGCRIFPLTPRRKKDGTMAVRMDRRAFAMCPLAPSGARGLSPAFVETATRALSLIDSDPDGRAFLDRWIKLERQFAEATL